MVIKQFDKANLKDLRNDIDAALKQVMDKHGISLSIGNISFNAGRFTTRMTGQLPVTTENKIVLENPIFQQYGFNIGDTFVHNTKVMKITGYNSRRPKNCVELQDQNGKKFSTSLDMVKVKFAK